MVAVKNINELKQIVNKDLAKSFENEVNLYVKKKVSKRIKTDVYGAYSPQVYKRRHLLYMDKNHTKEVFSNGNDEVYYKYEHRAMMKSGNLSKLIILGQEGARNYNSEPVAMYKDKYIQSYKDGGGSDSTAFYKPRDFISGAKSDININDIVRILKGG